MKSSYIALAALATAFTACTAPTAQPPAPAGSPSPSAAASPAPAAQVDVAAIVKAYKSAYVRINQTPVNTSGAHSGPKILYVDQANAALYKPDFRGSVPVGATYVKTTEDESFIAIMQKRAPGTDPGADDWYYYEKIGANVVFDGNTRSGGGLCHGCHKFGHSYDNLLGLDVFKPN